MLYIILVLHIHATVYLVVLSVEELLVEVLLMLKLSVEVLLVEALSEEVLLMLKLSVEVLLVEALLL